MNEAARFWSHVEKTETCWLWTGPRDTKSGYARFEAMGKHTYVHRFAYELLVGPIPEGLSIDHLCRVRHCVNPVHLEPVTNRENIMRGRGSSAVRAHQVECVHGHAFTPANTYVSRSGFRNCRECHRLRMRARRGQLTRGVA